MAKIYTVMFAFVILSDYIWQPNTLLLLVIFDEIVFWAKKKKKQIETSLTRKSWY